MLHIPTPFPCTGSICFRKHTAEPARILRVNDDATALLERRRRLPDGSTAPMVDRSASGNITVPLADLYADGEAAMLAGQPRRRTGARKARR